MEALTDLEKFDALVRRDKTATVMLGAALFLTLFLLLAIGVFARMGFGRAGLLEIALGLTGLFAAAGIVIGAARSIRGGRAAKNRAA